MSELEADIARIAALRGRIAADYSPQELDRRAFAQALATISNPSSMNALFTGSPTMARRDLEAVDALPPRTRTWVKEAPIWVNAVTVAGFLETLGGRELPVLEACDRAMLAMVKYLARRHYGPTHPNAGDHAR